MVQGFNLVVVLIWQLMSAYTKGSYCIGLKRLRLPEYADTMQAFLLKQDDTKMATDKKIDNIEPAEGGKRGKGFIELLLAVAIAVIFIMLTVTVKDYFNPIPVETGFHVQVHVQADGSSYLGMKALGMALLR